MRRDEVERELARLALLPKAAPHPDPPPASRGEGDGALPPLALRAEGELLLGLESLALTLDDSGLRALALASLALTRAERGERERAFELAAMSRRAGERVESAVLLGEDMTRRFEEFAAELAQDGRRLDLLRDVPAWMRALRHAGATVKLDFLESLDERIRGVVLLECAPSILGTPGEPRARELARALLASDAGFAVAFAVEALVALEGFTADDAEIARRRLVNGTLDAGALDALASVARHVEIEVPDTGDLRADALVRLVLARRAGEVGDLETGRGHLAQAVHAVHELRSKRRNVDATRVLACAIPLAPLLHTGDVALLESIIEDPIVAWAPSSAREVLEALALAVPRIVDPGVSLGLVEDWARLALRRIKTADNERPRLMFRGLGALARGVGLVGAGAVETDLRWKERRSSVLDRIAAGAREAVLAPKGMFGSGKPLSEYFALLGVGEARARTGDLVAIEGAIDALEGIRAPLVPHLLDEALESALELDSAPLAQRVLDVVRSRLDEPPVARWLGLLAARAHGLVGARAVAKRLARREESRERGRLRALLV
ncbi:MAG TPA: hypothetical protein VFF73_08650 [Planctomycetota bacterium]|nr:hypothetical protein [Planctomycetota bacterium]